MSGRDNITVPKSLLRELMSAVNSAHLAVQDPSDEVSESCARGWIKSAKKALDAWLTEKAVGQ